MIAPIRNPGVQKRSFWRYRETGSAHGHSKSYAFGLLILLAAPAQASHDWFGQDLCRSFPERMPPGIAPADLPEPASPGAVLLAGHCAQCHQLPGPGHHTAAEWPAIVQRMQLLVEVTSRFGGRPDLKIPNDTERQVIADYLQRHALRPLPAGLDAPDAYLSACGDCHAAPDPALHTSAEWPAVFTRMAGLRPLMAREPLNSWTATQALAFLSDQAAPPPDAPRNTGRWAALAPVALLLLFALVRLGRLLGSTHSPLRHNQ